MLPKALVSANGRPRGVTGKRLGSPGSALRSADHSQAHRLLNHAGQYPAAPWRCLFWAWAIVFGRPGVAARKRVRVLLARSSGGQILRGCLCASTPLRASGPRAS